MPALAEDDIDIGPEAPSFPPLPQPVQPPPSAPAPIAQSIPIPPSAPTGVPWQDDPRWSSRTPAQSFSDPAYQRQVEQDEMAIYKRAQNVEQAQKDVSSARRMLGILKADRERQEMERAGVPPGEAMQKAMFQNMQYFAQPGDKNFAPSFNAVRPPPPPPTMQNFTIPGTTNQVPAIVAPSRNGNQVHIVPRNALPQAEDTSASTLAKPILSDKGELLGYTVKTGPQTFSHKWLADMDPATKEQIKQNTAELKEAGGEKRKIEKEASANGDTLPDAFKRNPDLQARWQEQTNTIGRLRQENIALATKGTRKPAPAEDANTPTAPVQSDRVRVKSPDGRVGTISRSNLDKARKAGYSVMDGSD